MTLFISHSELDSESLEEYLPKNRSSREGIKGGVYSRMYFMKLKDILFPTQKITIPKTKDILELELESIFVNKNRFFFYKEIVTDKLFVRYKSQMISLYKSFKLIDVVQVIEINNKQNWELEIVVTEEFASVYKYLFLIFPIIFLILFFIFGHFQILFFGFLASCFIILLNYILLKLDLIKWKRLIVNSSL